LIPEVLLSLLIAAAMYFFLTALEPRAGSWRWYAGYAMMALGVLTKGLIALVFPCGAAFFFLLATGEWRRWREFRFASGFVLFLAIAAPWHILAGLRNPGTAEHPGFFWFYFVNEHYLRFLGRRYPRDYNNSVLVVAFGVAVSVELLSSGSDQDCDRSLARAAGRFEGKRCCDAP
jgi:4-amino-4-deoxy-L-arabinose transferase-like glycosyltransferase